MTPEEIQAEWDAFIEYPEGSGKLYVTTTSALIFARSIVAMAEKRESDSLSTQNQALLAALKGLVGSTLVDSTIGTPRRQIYENAVIAIAAAEGKCV